MSGVAAPLHAPQRLARDGILVEAADTASAVAMFNVMTQEGRSVVAALLPAAA